VYIMMYYLSIRTVLKLFARDWLVRIIWPDGRHLNKASVTRKRNYNERLAYAGRLFVIGDFVWLHNVPRKKGKNAKLDCPWERPYVVISLLSDVVYRIQKRRKAQPKVDHSDRLKPYLGPPLERWIPKRQTQLSSPRRGEREIRCVFVSLSTTDSQFRRRERGS